MYARRFGDHLVSVRLLSQVAGVWVGVVGLATGEAGDLPRYKLAVGQELVYRTTDPPIERDDGNGGKATSHNVTEWIIRVAGENDDGSRWLVFSQKTKTAYSSAGKEHKQQYDDGGHFLLTGDGRMVENATIRPMSDPTRLFPPLPPNSDAWAACWQASLQLDETRRTLRAADGDRDADPGVWRFVEQSTTALDPIYEMTTERDYAFDRDLGLVRKVVSRFRQNWPASQAGKSTVQTIELIETRQPVGTDRAAVAVQARAYLDAVEAYQLLADEALGNFAETAKGLIRAERELVKVKDSLTLPWLQEMFDAKFAQHRRNAQFAIQDAVAFNKLLNQPSAEWQTTDLDGHPYVLADLRGKVVVLDFWYRGCGWCIRAMPQMNQLADDFAGQPVAILGINSDQNLDDARFVVDRMGLNYPTLKNQEYPNNINGKYKIHGWPTLVVIDRQGIVRKIHFGYKPTLRAEIGQLIRQLLAAPAG